jgi:hypothetical protein
MSPGFGVRHSISSSSLGKPFRRSDKSQDDGSASKASSQVDLSLGLGFDSASLAGGPSTPFLSIDKTKEEIVGILNPRVHDPEGLSTVSERLDEVNARIMEWDADNANPKLKATARYYLTARLASRTLFNASIALQPLPGRKANVKSAPLNKAMSALQVAAAAASHVPGVPVAIKVAESVYGIYSQKKNFEFCRNKERGLVESA